MEFSHSQAVLDFRAEVRAVINESFTDEVRDRIADTGTLHSWPLHHAIGERGWIREALPEAQGGGGRDPLELSGLFAELELSGAPYDGLANVVMVASTLAHVGNEMVKQEVLPQLLDGTAVVCLGYSEPDAGSDVAAARTRAVRDGDGWRIDGQKMFTSVAEEAKWIFLLARTSNEGSKHRGLTFFLIPMDTPGISIQEVRTLPGKRVNITFLDDVHIGDEWRVGDIDGGWNVMVVALSFERGMAGGVREGERMMGIVEEWARRAPDTGGPPPIDDPVVRERLVRLAIENEVADLLTGRAAWVAASGQLPGTEGAAARMFASDSYTRAASWAIDVAGPEGVVHATEREGSIEGFFDHCYRAAPGSTLAGGTTEIQRNLIAQRGLGLPRAR